MGLLRFMKAAIVHDIFCLLLLASEPAILVSNFKASLRNAKNAPYQRETALYGALAPHVQMKSAFINLMLTFPAGR